MRNVFLFLIASFFLSSIASATWWSRSDAMPDEHVSGQEVELEIGRSIEKSEISLQCSNPRGTAFFQSHRNDFGSVSGAHDWCFGFFDQYGIERTNDNLFRHCSWTRHGQYGRYQWNAVFVFIVEFYGSPQISVQHFCGDDGGGGSGGGGY